VRKRLAILVLDVITDFRFPGGAVVRKAFAKRAPALARLLARARRAGVPVIYVNDDPGPWRSDAPGLLRRCAARSPAVAGLIRQLEPLPQDLVILKPRHSGFYATPLQPLLESLRVDTLVLTGLSTESCVWITACDAHTRGFGLIVPMDTMAGLSERAVTASLTGLRTTLAARTPATAARVRLRSH
jgi:nicotinamidase-related amidase